MKNEKDLTIVWSMWTGFARQKTMVTSIGDAIVEN